jgi:aspartate/glutamate racemase
VGAAIHYYQRLARAHDDRSRTLHLVMAHAETSHIFKYIEANNPVGMAEYLTDFLHRLKASGAEIGVIPAVTPLYCAHHLAAAAHQHR